MNHRTVSNPEKQLFSKPGGLVNNRNFVRLAVAQFLGVINDHLFKMVVALYAVAAASEAGGSEYLSLSGALFVVPYLLFSGYAGRLADRYEKRSVIVITKFLEIVIMALACAALFDPTEVQGLLIVLFLTATQSAFFSPSKFGYIPEIVSPGQLIRANGTLEALRYTAVILGTLAGGLLMQVWQDNPLRIGTVVIAIATAGFLASLGFGKTAPAGRLGRGHKGGHGYFYSGLLRIARSRTLAISVASMTFFEATATLALMDVLLLAKNDLNAGDGLAGLLPACGAVGAGFGTYACGRICGFRVNLGLSPIAGAGLTAALLCTAFASSSYIALALALIFVGFFGGMFFVPYLTWLQKSPGSGERGLVISTNNFLNMAGVLAASGALWLLHDLLNVSSRSVLLICTAATALFVLLTIIVSGHVRKRALQLLIRWLHECVKTLSRYAVHTPALRCVFPDYEEAHSRWFHQRPIRAISAIVMLGICCMATAALAGEESTRTAYRIEHGIFGEIGNLTQEVRDNGYSRRVETRVNIRVSLLGIPFFRMDAEWVEDWKNGELYRYSGTTVTNGDTERIVGQRYSDRFRIDTAYGTIHAPFEIQPAIPSSIRFVDASVFMSPETGRVTRSRFVEGNPPSIAFTDQLEKVRMFRAHVEGDHTVYFDDYGRLIRFEYPDPTGKITVTRLPNMDDQKIADIPAD